jgi:hypothetical protein
MKRGDAFYHGNIGLEIVSIATIKEYFIDLTASVSESQTVAQPATP